MEQITLDRDETVLIHGFLSDCEVFAMQNNKYLLGKLTTQIENQIIDLVGKGFNTFLYSKNGLFELIVASVVRNLQKDFSALHNITVMPYPGCRTISSEFHPDIYSDLIVYYSDNSEFFQNENFIEYLHTLSSCTLTRFGVENRRPFNTGLNLRSVPGARLSVH